MIRLDRLLSNRGYCSRSEVKALLKEGVVLVNGAPIKKPDEHVEPSSVTFNSEPLDAETITVAVNKPCGFVCSHKEQGRLIYELFPERWGNRKPLVSTVGRLDKETSGLIIVTDDGQLHHKLTQPSKVGKKYIVTLSEPLKGDESQILASGTLILETEHSALLPAKFIPTGTNTGELTIFEGRYHQVRRMFAALGNKVEVLHRESIGGFNLNGIPEGKWIHVTDKILQLLGQEPQT